MMASARPLLTSDRVQVFLTLVPYLLERGEVSVQDAARDFDVTVPQMRRMVEMLTVIGLPGEGGHWQQPHELFDINWDLLEQHQMIEITNDVGLQRVPRLTAREAAALLAGLRLVAGLPAVADSDLVSGLVAKLSRGSAGIPAEVIVAPEPVDEVRSLVATALERRVALSFTYRAPDASPTTRTVDPTQIMSTDGQWYLQGWCHLRRAMRTFHLERVSDAALTDTPVEDRAVPDSSLFHAGDADDEVLVRVPEAIAPLLSSEFPGSYVASTEAPTVVAVPVGDIRAAKRWAGRLGSDFEVISPKGARTTVREWAKAGLALYSED